MGHHARTLAAVIAVLAATLIAASTAGAYPYVVRAETRDMNSIASGAFYPRTAVEANDVTITDDLGVAAPKQCSARSPVAALIAAFGPTQVKTIYDANSGKWLIRSLKGYGPDTMTPPTQPKWSWRIYVDQSPIDGAGTTGNWEGGDVCADPPYDPAGTEVLAYQFCGTQTFGCYSNTPLYLRIRDGGPYDIAPQTVPGRGSPVSLKLYANLGGAVGGLLGTDESTFTPYTVPDTGPQAGLGAVSFTEYGNHQVIAVAQNGSRPPARMAVCVSEGNDGFCGSTKVSPPPDIPYGDSPCATNGHDGLCGTIDTSGPVTHVSNIANKQVFKAKKGPGQVKGTIDTDPNGVGAVKLRLTRVVSVKVKVKVKTKRKKGSKKKPKTRYRYKTVKRCSAWSDDTLLLTTTKKCGTKYGKWWTADLSDLRNEFTYSFALKLPRGTYTLEVSATDEDGHVDAPAPGRNVLVFTVK